MNKKGLVIALVLFAFLSASVMEFVYENTVYMPLISYEPADTPTPTATQKPPTEVPTPTPTKPPVSTPIPDYPYDWLVPGSAVNVGDETKIGGAKPSMCHKVYSQKSGKTIYLWVEYFGWSRTECETAMNKDYSHVPESHFPLPVCEVPVNPFFPPANFPCVCPYFGHNDFCEAFGIDYPGNSQEVCAITDGCIETK